jgi:hypothetical protein
MDEDEPIGIALLIVRGCHEQRPEERNRCQHDSRPGDERQDGIGELLEAERIGERVHGPNVTVAAPRDASDQQPRPIPSAATALGLAGHVAADAARWRR